MTPPQRSAQREPPQPAPRAVGRMRALRIASRRLPRHAHFTARRDSRRSASFLEQGAERFRVVRESSSRTKGKRAALSNSQELARPSIGEIDFGETKPILDV